MYEELYYNIDDTGVFLERICMDPAEFMADKAHLDQLLYNFHRYVPFDNLDVWAEAALPSLAIPDLFDKIVRRRRGGYCFEMNGFLEAALRTLGYECYSAEIRIVRGRDYLPPSRHRAVVAIVDGKKHFCDVGLGFKFFQQSAGFNDGYNDFGIKAVYNDGVCEIFERGDNGEDKRVLYFEDRPALPIDFLNPNFCCSQDPSSGFRTRLSMVIMTPEGYRKNLVCNAPAPKNREKYLPEFTVTVKNGSEVLSEKTYYGAAELEKHLKEDFGVEYTF